MELPMLVGLLVVAIAMIAYALWPDNRDKEQAAERRASGIAKDKDPAAITRRAKESVAAAMFERAAPLLSKPVMPKSDAEHSTLRMKMSNAGFRRENSPVLFLASKTVVAVVGGAVGGFYAVSNGKSMMSVASLIAIGASVGFLFPNGWLWLAIKQRAEKIMHGLPDALDLMVISVEAGLGLDAALLRVGDELRHVHPELSEEFQVASIETQMGVRRADALTRMADRSAVPEVKSLVAVISQAEKLGTSIASALRNQADALRTKRRQKAEERAQKTAVKLMLPLILFIFPAILIVLGGPAGIKLYQTMASGSGGALSGQ